MSESCVQPCLSWSAFKVMSLMTRPFCCSRYAAVDASTVPPNAGCVFGTDLNCSESLGCHPPVKAVIHPFEITDRCGLPGTSISHFSTAPEPAPLFPRCRLQGVANTLQAGSCQTVQERYHARGVEPP